MKATLIIYKDGEQVNAYEWTDETDVLREFAKCMTEKYRRMGKVRVQRFAYGSYRITQTWPYAEAVKGHKYVYTFEGIE